MTRYNPRFELTVEDVDLIEAALHKTQDVLSQSHLAFEHKACMEEGVNQEKATRVREKLAQVQDLLGRLHNQRVFCRPGGEAYVGG